ncbi:glycosyltransferase [Halodesulfovibrio marinisediminis]|uniref:Glycosyl transferase family 2 n=1 Tax=Halodesulfovibrio marinisediminis DSM 17456 TaxID=1121457 RepID=A0A1N6JCA0_9BACT|nr:glycosyltransferase [Halodesulfovibrio marinisediminis]SIO41982.1 Glycosyl transferase family 2 [Halodesulfovibrio marinisediminis DSM 17456]
MHIYPPIVSVVMPVYNGAKTLNTAVDSILAQTFTDFELIIIDDGSTDFTLEVINGYVAQDERVRGFTIPHSGVAAAANFGLSKTRARLIARMDADDYSMPERLAQQVSYMHGHPEIGILGTCVEFGGNRNTAGGYARYVDWTNTLLEPEEISLRRFQEAPFAHPSTMYRAELVERYGGYKLGNLPEDYELWLRWMALGIKAAKLQEKLVVWNDPPNRLSRTGEQCTVENFYKMKSPYLADWLHNYVSPEKNIYVIGAGKTSRQRALLLEQSGVVIKGWIDIDPNKIGNIVNGKRVVSRAILDQKHCFSVAYLGGHDANEQLEEFMQTKGYTLGEDYILAS